MFLLDFIGIPTFYLHRAISHKQCCSSDPFSVFKIVSSQTVEVYVFSILKLNANHPQDLGQTVLQILLQTLLRLHPTSLN